MDKIKENSINYCKYFSDSKDVINGLLKDKKLRFTQPWAFNDPLEFNPKLIFNFNDAEIAYNFNDITLPSLELFTRIHLIESEINNYGVLSLTKNPLSFDMWNLYSNGHKGFLVEFRDNFDEHEYMLPKNNQNQKYFVKPVQYDDEYSIEIDKIVKEKNLKSFDYIFDKLFYHKTKRWKHENEYRLVRLLSDKPDYIKNNKTSPYRDENIYLFDFSLECVESIVLGAHMSIENKELIIEKCKEFNIDIYQAFIIRDMKDEHGYEGKVTFVKIGESPNLLTKKKLIQMMPQLFCMNYSYYCAKKENIKIQSLSELPYYKGNENNIEQIFDKLLKRKLDREF